MKNIQLLPGQGEIHDYVRSLWPTDMFRNAHVPGGFVNGIVDRFARLPRFFYEMSDPQAEQAHFSVWWGGMGFRQYENPYSQDLYLLHDFVHGGAMTYIAGQNLECFTRKMTDNELYASIMTEIIAYFALPGLREAVAFKEIFADRFLVDETYQKKWRQDPERMVDEIYYRRRQAMLNPRPGDDIEKWLHFFTQQNNAWFNIWQGRYDVVETKMERLSIDILSGSRRDILRRHVDWLLSDEIAQGGDIPFPVEARAFGDIYWQSREKYMRPKLAVA